MNGFPLSMTVPLKQNYSIGKLGLWKQARKACEWNSYIVIQHRILCRFVWYWWCENMVGSVRVLFVKRSTGRGGGSDPCVYCFLDISKKIKTKQTTRTTHFVKLLNFKVWVWVCTHSPEANTAEREGQIHVSVVFLILATTKNQN